jgi:hypothetical protein
LRALIIVPMALIGLVLGALVGAVLGGTGGTAATIGLIGGLAAGILLARNTYPPKQRPPIDAGRYPNRVIRRRDRGG